MEPESFEEFCIQWKEEQTIQLHELTTATKISKDSSTTSVHDLVNRAISHYEKFNETKSKWVQLHSDHVFMILSASWYSPFEDAFRWIGGWRPSTAFHLLYSKSGLQFEAKIILNISTSSDNDHDHNNNNNNNNNDNDNDNYNLGDLTLGQLKRIDTLQRRTIREEREITEEMAKQQETAADAEMVQLSHEISKLIRNKRKITEEDNKRVDLALKSKGEGFQRILESAGDLRLRTIKGIIELLSPIQAVHFLIAAAELQLRLHEWGREREKTMHKRHDKASTSS